MATTRHVEHLVIGAGFAGLGTAIKLQEDGENDFVVIEKAGDVGGTWRCNDYPGAACDVPSHLYSFSFAPNPDWTKAYSAQPEIQAYLRKVAATSGTLDRFRFETTVESAEWDEAAQVWRVRTTSAAGEQTYTATTLISGAGGLSAPRLPDIDGIEGFLGEVFHSARWNHDVDLAGKRVAVIGTGASAVQIVPEIQPQVDHMDVYQRTAPYVLPRNERSFTRAEKFLFKHVPAVMRAYRAGIYCSRETYVPAFTVSAKIAAPAKAAALRNLRKGIADGELRAKVTPSYEIGCKRILISNTYYPALAADNVDVVTDRIAKVTGNAIVTAAGVERTIDVLIVATGFHTTDLPIADIIRGRGGRTLAEVWAEQGMSAYKGTTVNGFPNFFMMVGPNTGLGHSSMVFVIESQIAYLRDAIRTMRTHRYATIEPKAAAVQRWNDDLQRRMKRTVWSTGGCSSWYLDEHGRNTTLWPRTTFTLRRLLSRFDVAAYQVEAPTLATEQKTDQKKVSA